MSVNKKQEHNVRWLTVDQKKLKIMVQFFLTATSD